jgi:GTP-binding protein Era
MLAFSHDPEAGTLYVYFTELEAGQIQDSLEYPAHLLLDAQGQIMGLQLDLDDELTLANLELALDGDFERLDMETGRLRVRISDEEPVRIVPLAEAAILDLDADDTLLGVELTVPAALRSPTALARIALLMVTLDDAVIEGEGPVVFRPEASMEPEDGPVVAETVDQPTASAPSQPTGRSGFVALVGKPNVGKSTLLNALLGQKVAIVSPRPQTTRVPTRGILSQPGAQIIFIDTPGIHQPHHALGRFMVDLAEQTLPNADIIGFMVDISQPPSELDRRIAQQIKRARGRRLLILNKVDLKPRGERSYLADYRDLGVWEAELAISAQRRMGLTALLDAIVERLPVGPPLYPEEQVTDQSEQQLAAEFVREKVLFHTQHEVPHAVAVVVDEWEERDRKSVV